ncbi:MAG: hypothetical protein ACOX6T_03350 [Myxococcales bacterium]
MVPRVAGELTTLVARLLAHTHSAGELLAPCIATDWARPEVIEACRLHRLAVVDQTGTLVLQAGAILIHAHGLVDPASLLRASLETGGPSWAALAGFYAPSTSPEALRAAREESARLGIPTLFTLSSATSSPYR